MRYALDAIDIGRDGPVLGNNHHLVPDDSVRIGGIESLVRSVPHGDTEYIEVLSRIFVIYGGDVRDLGAARTAPACPEVHKYVFALAHKVGKGKGLLLRSFLCRYHTAYGEVLEALVTVAYGLGKHGVRLLELGFVRHEILKIAVGVEAGLVATVLFKNIQELLLEDRSFGFDDSGEGLTLLVHAVVYCHKTVLHVAETHLEGSVQGIDLVFLRLNLLGARLHVTGNCREGRDGCGKNNGSAFHFHFRV